MRRPNENPDPAGPEVLLAEHVGAARALARRFVRDRERADELAQDALLLAWRRLPEFRGDSSVRTWVLGITRNVCFNALRRRTETLVEDGVLDPEDPDLGALSALAQHEREALLMRAARALTAEEQEAIHLRYVERVPQDTITQLLGLTDVSGGRGLLQRCRRKLERALRAELALLGHGSSFFRGVP